jgi:hypothetical protein
MDHHTSTDFRTGIFTAWVDCDGVISQLGIAASFMNEYYCRAFWTIEARWRNGALPAYIMKTPLPERKMNA